MPVFTVSHEEAPFPSYSTDTTLNFPSDLPGMIHQVYVAAPEGGQLDNHMASNMHERGQPIAGNCLEGGSNYWPGEGSDTYRQTLPDLPYLLLCI